ncbi:hypothetical protein AT984_02170 [Paucibacter sp. KCTC 42545]|nr:hypothetical protein AT984_02170 [Paucibacter sp. KCTC 42545]
MAYWALIAPSSLLAHIGIKGLHSTIFVLIVALTLAIFFHKKLSYQTFIAGAILLTLSFGNVIHWNDLRYLFFCIFFLCALILVDLAGLKGIEQFCRQSSSLMLVLLVGSVIGALLAGAGAGPLFTITNPDGQDYYFFYSTFTNSYQENLIRAAGIYDEPGAFSMYLCFIAALRHLLRQDRKTTWIILILGFITFSLAHLVYVVCHLLAEQSSKRKIFSFIGIAALALFIAATTIAIDSNIILLSRLKLSEDTNLIAGDNRSFQLINAWLQLQANPSAILFGLDSTCEFSQLACQEVFGPLGENPLSPLVFGGLFSELPYYATVLLLIVSPAYGKRNIVLLGIGLLFLQRPYVMGFSYSLIAVMLVYIFLKQPFGARHFRRRPAKAPLIHQKSSIAAAQF